MNSEYTDGESLYDDEFDALEDSDPTTILIQG